MSTLNDLVSHSMRSERTADITTLKVGQSVMALEGRGSFAECFPPKLFIITKINKKTFTASCGKKVDLINIRQIL